MGAGDIVVPARAVAVVTEVINKCNVLPMAIENRVQRYDQDGNPIGSPVPYDQTYGYMVRLRMSPGNAYESGNFGSLALRRPRASAYRDYIANGGGCVESDVLPTETGAMDGPTEQGFAALIEKAIGPSASWPACGSPHPDNPAIPVECTLGIRITCTGKGTNLMAWALQIPPSDQAAAARRPPITLTRKSK